MEPDTTLPDSPQLDAEDVQASVESGRFSIEPKSLTYLRESELNLLREQESNPNRARVIALTHIQTAILWIEKSLKT